MDYLELMKREDFQITQLDYSFLSHFISLNEGERSQLASAISMECGGWYPTRKHIAHLRVIARLFIGDSSYSVRCCGLEILGDFGNRHDVPVILKFLPNKPDPLITALETACALEALAMAQGFPALKRIERHFDADDYIIRFCAYPAYVIAGGKDVALLMEHKEEEEDDVASLAVLEALSLLGDKSSHDELTELMETHRLQTRRDSIRNYFNRISFLLRRLPELKRLQPQPWQLEWREQWMND